MRAPELKVRWQGAARRAVTGKDAPLKLKDIKRTALGMVLPLSVFE